MKRIELYPEPVLSFVSLSPDFQFLLANRMAEPCVPLYREVSLMTSVIRTQAIGSVFDSMFLGKNSWSWNMGSTHQRVPSQP